MTCPEDQATCPPGQPAPTPVPDPTTLAICPKDQATCPPGQPAPIATCPPGQLTPRRPAPRSGPPFGVHIELHPVLRTALLVAWAALSGACSEQGSDPVRAAQAFTAAVRSGDMTAVLPLLEKAALARLEQSAAQASDQVGGRRSIEPAEMLQIVDVSPTFELANTELVDNDGATAHVRLLGAQQETYTLTLVHEDGAWHVRIPIP
ncbi:hypothetical protein [Nannocystis sp.]|uniref:hypothetical protein n=1 Tax=Nannocystis sp. TaxID=1962667 RepID=UPI0025CBB7DA|nr:hypothetical protein [Nannocystis sp.]MBK7830072.1 hypothetical protein [Nannocystis sp.]